MEQAVASPDIRDRLAIVMAHPDDEVLWASSALRAAERIVLVYGALTCGPQLTEGRRAAMAAFPLPTLDWLDMVEPATFDSASWPHPRETDYGLYPHRALRVLASFDADRYRAQFAALQARLRISLDGIRNVIVHSPWGEYGHEDHVQVFRVVASLAEEMQFRVWVPAYDAPKSAALMQRNLRFFGRPTEPMPTDKALAEEISRIYKRTDTWTWFDSYVWPDSERFLPYQRHGAPAGAAAAAGDVQRIVFPADYEASRRAQLTWKREAVRRFLSWKNGRSQG
jgi:LmbE family N-acetylglucosaminyl deacetylase